MVGSDRSGLPALVGREHGHVKVHDDEAGCHDLLKNGIAYEFQELSIWQVDDLVHEWTQCSSHWLQEEPRGGSSFFLILREQCSVAAFHQGKKIK